MKELTNDNLQEVIASNKKVIVQYGAAWCGACRIIKPKFAGLAKENEEVEFYYVDAEKYPNSRQVAEVNNLPTFAGFVDGKLVKQTQGTKDTAISEVLSEVTGN